MNQEQKERLEQELRFLKESLEADVISKDEYERGRERIERKLKELEEPEEELEKKEEIEEEPEIEIKEIKKKPTRKVFIEEEEIPEEEAEEIEEKAIEEEKEDIEEAEQEPEETEIELVKEEEEEGEEKVEEAEKPEEEEITISKKWLYGIAILIVIVILFFSIRGCKKPIEEESSITTAPIESPEEESVEEKTIEKFTPECSSDSDCKQEGSIGKCLNPGTKEAKCEFEEDIKTNLVVINDKNCKLCDSSTMKTILKTIFPNVNTKEIDYETPEAKNLINKLNINALPAYIFDSSVSKATNFNDFKTALIKKEDSYIMTNTASGAVYYFKRPLIKNKLDLYVLPETDEKIETNAQEVLDLFKDKIVFTKNAVIEEQKELLKKELAINTYPAFLLNNQYTFRGILPANIIKEKICQVNYFEECKKELSKI